jgi:leucyl-tRNA synthetase
MVLAPEHPLVDRIVTREHVNEVREYQKKAALKSEIDRGLDKEKSGIFTGAFAMNPATKKKIPIWIADYVLMGYGTGSIMAVPGQDERDWEFAENFGLPIVRTVQPRAGFGGKPYLEDGPAINSGFLDGLYIAEAKEKIIQWVESEGIGRRKVNYKLRDWLFSRQRYWGEPIPIVHREDGTMYGLSDKELPLLLPELEKFQPSGTTESPLAIATDWVNVVDPVTGQKGRRETNTMPQWAGSCWYYLRYLDPDNDAEPFSRDNERSWMPVDLYIGGSEHTVLHLMYARFWHKLLYDLGYTSTKEPFICLRHQGMILGEDSRKMSKSRGNVVNPDDVVAQHGADAMRLFEMFMGPLEEVKPWSTRGVEGLSRFLGRVWRLYINDEGNTDPSLQEIELTPEMERSYHATVKKITEDIEALRFNTAIAQMMIFVNDVTRTNVRPRQILEPFLLVLSPFAPHLAEELWERLGHTRSIAYEKWPLFDPAKLSRETIEIVLQVNGKVRSKIEVSAGASEDDLRELALADESVKRHMAGKTLAKAIVVKNKLVNIVVR